MRILVVSNFFPPHAIGGYELGCADVVEALIKDGHEVRVLTSTYRVDRPVEDGNVFRWLQSSLGWQSRNRLRYVAALIDKERRNQRAFERACRRHQPDLVYVWNAALISISIVLQAQRKGIPVCFFVSDEWISKWESDDWYSFWNRTSARPASRLAKGLLRPVLSLIGVDAPRDALDLSHVQFASNYLRNSALRAGLNVAGSEVIHWGVDVNRFNYRVDARTPSRLLFVGQVTRHKGVHTAIDALRILSAGGIDTVSLTIVGGSVVPDYVQELRSTVRSSGLADRVSFLGFRERHALPAIFRDHDILIFPSAWAEPFSITLLEAMASGLAVVTTNTGGTPEILESGENGLSFEPNDADGCAKQILRLLRERDLSERIRSNARRSVVERFTFESMLKKIRVSLANRSTPEAIPQQIRKAG
jgi:glycogen(starch) synthase